ncbi:MAG: amidohydrolase [Halanaerobiales bacterium]
MKAIVNGKIFTMAGENYENGDILIENGIIKEIGRKLDIPDNAEIYDAKNKIVFPGFIDGHTHLGIGEEDIGWAGQDYNEKTDPITSNISALDAINPLDTGFKDAYKNGITTAMVAPGSSNVIGGKSVILKTHGKIVDEMVVKKSAGIKAALGENPKGAYGDNNETPKTRMAIAGLLRQALNDTKNYMIKKEEKTNKNEYMEIDLNMEPLIDVLTNEIPLRIHAHRADDIITAIRIAKEFDIDIIIEHCTEGHLVAEEIAEANVPVMVGPSFGGRSKVELKNKTFKTAGILAKAGVKIAIISDHSVTPTQFLPLYAALSIKAGMNREEALKAITINPAEIMGIDDKVGSIEKGKDADLIIFNGDPLEIMTEVETVFINGEKIVN